MTVTEADRLRRLESRVAQLEDWRSRTERRKRPPGTTWRKPTREQIVFALFVAAMVAQIAKIVADIKRGD